MQIYAGLNHHLPSLASTLRLNARRGFLIVTMDGWDIVKGIMWLVVVSTTLNPQVLFSWTVISA